MKKKEVKKIVKKVAKKALSKQKMYCQKCAAVWLDQKMCPNCESLDTIPVN